MTLYLNTKITTFTIADSTELLNLANLCPYTEGGVVYQARALYNIVYTTFAKFNDNCNLGTGNRLFDNVVKDEPKDVNVVLKSKLYPNPNNGEFTIAVTKLKEQKQIEVFVFDVTGKLVYSDVKLAMDNILTLKPGLTNGLYLVKVKLADNTFDVHRLIIE